ncbi:chemotaxis protein CheB [Roseobacter sp. YSTF-M11]|uniref:Chemotaxis protein CheB n=1 Tax=Roseobacter insulae TaxID=2859783 RepID=A0A9X1FXE2_9RHOB|nr:chemotaxis protein CheB [Roseobacter insulae]MBW4709417.1 chemotaxis protein CheB [Roseobacter insulae]
MPRQGESGYVVAIGGSAGALDAVRELIDGLPRDLDAPIVVAIHGDSTSQLSEILQALCPLPVRKVTDGETLQPGWIYVVPGATHALFKDKQIRLSELVEDSGFRPSIDALFMTLASEYGDKAVGVVLSGTMNDGMRGAQIIYDMGGQTIVQDPETASFQSMPRMVINADHPRQILAARELGVWLGELIGQS